jgi:hydrogenase nickel incorporation protein HypA/HybF
MHEVSIMLSAMDIINENATQNSLKKITEVCFAIGELSCVSVDALNFAFESVCIGTVCEGAKLKINHIKANAFCTQCSTHFEIDRFNKVCPKCKSIEIDIQTGYELFIESINGG